jgi:anti-sigma regulatory factor (Ser/Thr protein kinase)
MGPILGAGIPSGGETFAIDDQASIALVREALRRLGVGAGLAQPRYESLISAASELGHNQLAHGHRGWMAVSAISRAGVAGLEVVAFDGGRGIADPTAALRGEPRSTGSLGVGLSAAYRLADEMDFDVRLGEGTYVAARKFAAPLPRTEVAIFGRPIQGETESGDDAAFVRTEDLLLVGLADGLGHGSEAREASARAMTRLRSSATEALDSLLAACHEDLQGTRGAVMAAARFDRKARELTHAASGNISTHVYRPKTSRRLASVSRVLGARGTPAPRIIIEREPLDLRPLLVMFSDGVSSRADLSDDLELLRQPALVVAHQLIQRHGRTTDDALVLVAS